MCLDLQRIQWTLRLCELIIDLVGLEDLALVLSNLRIGFPCRVAWFPVGLLGVR